MNSAGLATISKASCARLAVTLRRWGSKRSPSPRGASAAEELAHEQDDDRCLLPLELVDRADACDPDVLKRAPPAGVSRRDAGKGAVTSGRSWRGIGCPVWSNAIRAVGFAPIEQALDGCQADCVVCVQHLDSPLRERRAANLPRSGKVVGSGGGA